MADSNNTKIEMKSDSQGRPVIHVLGYAGMTRDQIDVWRSIKLVVPEPRDDDQDGTVYLMPVNSAGVPYVDADGNVPMFPAPPMQVGPLVDPNAMVSRADIVERTGLSLSTVKRAERAGDLGSASRISPRRVAYTSDQVRQWWDDHNAKLKGKAK